MCNWKRVYKDYMDKEGFEDEVEYNIKFYKSVLNDVPIRERQVLIEYLNTKGRDDMYMLQDLFEALSVMYMN